MCGQPYTTPGLLSGAGLCMMPSTDVAPAAHFRIDLGRIELLRASKPGANSVVLGCGMSSNLEIYARLIGEQTGSIASTTSVGYGGKLLLPFRLPVVRSAAIWFESGSSEVADPAATLSGQMNRCGILASTGESGSRGLFLAGASFNHGESSVLLGAGWVRPLTHSIMLSPEAVYGYLGRKSAALILNGAVRIVSNVSLQVSPGYVYSSGAGSGVIAFGLSVSTADFDYAYRPADQRTGSEVHLPTIEELQKQINDDQKEQPKKPANDGGSGSAVPSADEQGRTGELTQQGEHHQ